MITDIQMLAPGIEAGEEFDVEIDGVAFTFRPVKRCPGTGRDDYGHQRICRGVWEDYTRQCASGILFRFCPTMPDALGALTDRLWTDLGYTVERAHKERKRRDDAAAERRRADAALILLADCERVDGMACGDVQYLSGAKAAIRKARASL